MRTIEYASAFKKDYKRVKASPRYARNAESLLTAVLKLLVADHPLPPANRDHALTGGWISYRECHVKPDLLLIYRKSDEATLRLARVGSHSELFG